MPPELEQDTQVTSTPEDASTTPPAESLRDELSKNFDKSVTTEASAAVDKKAAASTSASVGAKATDAPPAGQKPGDDPNQDAKDVAALQAAAASNRPIPERLKAKWGSKWETLDSSVREQFHEYETDIGRVTSKYGKDAKSWDKTLRVFAPYEQMIRSEGGTLHTAMSQLLETARILRQGSPEQKVQLVKQMVQAYGINLSGTTGQVEGSAAASATLSGGVSAELIERINQLERGLLTRGAEETHNLRQQVNSVVDAFFADPANVYLQEPGYLDTMQALIKSGQAEDLKSAYDQAAWLHDRTREMEIAKRHASRTSADAEAAARARSAAISRNGSSPGPLNRDLSKLSLRDELAAHLSGDA